MKRAWQSKMKDKSMFFSDVCQGSTKFQQKYGKVQGNV